MSINGILVVSFGTSYEETEKKCITPLIEGVKNLYEDYIVRSAFTSRIIIGILKKRGRDVDTPEDAIRKMAEEGVEYLVVLPLHFMKGHEYEKKIVGPLSAYKGLFRKMVIADPLLSSEEDIQATAGFIDDLCSSYLKEGAGEKLLFMGHGTDHRQDRVYGELQEKLDMKGIPAHIGTVEGERAIEDIIPRLKKEKAGKVHLLPFMLVAGDHARNDMAGDENSWKTLLEEAGFDVQPHLRGMGEFFPLRRRYIIHLRKAMREIFPEKYARMREGSKKKTLLVPREEIPWYPTVSGDLCIGCGICYLYCPKGVYSMTGGPSHGAKAVTESPRDCVINCSKCADRCPEGAISFPEKLEMGRYFIAAEQ